MGIKVEIKDPVTVLVGPKGCVGPGTWGFYQFPKIWRARDGVIYLSVNIGADSAAGEHEPTRVFASPDGGRSWRGVGLGCIDESPEIFDLPDGRQVFFGARRTLNFLHENRTDLTVCPDELNMKPRMGPLVNPYGVDEYVFYNFADIPEKLRRFGAAARRGPCGEWENFEGAIDIPDMVAASHVRAGWWDGDGAFYWKDLKPAIAIPIPEKLAVLGDGTLLWALACQHPGVKDRFYDRVMCVASTDCGKMWTLRGIVAGDPEKTTWGYGFGEQSIALAPNGDLLCAMRTKSSNDMGHTHYLPLSRSSDGGRTWSAPEPVAEFSVTPHLLALQNGAMALIYGRPGVHVKLSADSGRTWGDAVTLVGTPERDILKMPLEEWWQMRHDESCANTGAVVTGPDKFIVAYSDFKHLGAEGDYRKAIKIREITVVFNTDV